MVGHGGSACINCLLGSYAYSGDIIGSQDFALLSYLRIGLHHHPYRDNVPNINMGENA